jgi:hypothetical protein
MSDHHCQGQCGYDAGNNCRYGKEEKEVVKVVFAEGRAIGVISL